MDSIAGKPVYRSLYEHLRVAILSGQLKSGAKLPSTRAMAAEPGISRNTVLNAYDQLMAEGYLESRPGSGTFVACILPEQFMTPPVPKVPRVSETASVTHQLSWQSWQTTDLPAPRTGLAFQAGIPALDKFPFECWSKLITKYVRYVSPELMTYQDRAGYLPLREAIASYVTVVRRINCTPEQIIITSGAQGALHLAARVLLNPGDPAWIEDPGYTGARGVLLSAGAQVIPVPVDDEGLRVETGVARAPHAKLVYVTPSHQFPLGMTMSLRRRLALMEWAKKVGAFILEDDYDGEYRFVGYPLAALQSLDSSDCVLYIGTFSKVLFPALRLGYLIVPLPLIERFLKMRQFIDNHPPILEQMALTAFIAEGHLSRHIRRMRVLYAERRDLLIEALKDLPLEVYAPDTGMHLIGWLPNGVDDRKLSLAAAKRGIFVMPVSQSAIEPVKRPGIMLGYAATGKQAIQDGVRHLAAALHEAEI